MSTQIKLDTNALTSLIEKDDDFRLSLQQAAIENISSRILKKFSNQINTAFESKLNKIEENINNKINSEIVRWNDRIVASPELSDQAEELIKKEIKLVLNQEIYKIQKEEKSYIKKQLDDMLKIINYELENSTKKLKEEAISIKETIINNQIDEALESRIKIILKRLLGV